VSSSIVSPSFFCLLYHTFYSCAIYTSTTFIMDPSLPAAPYPAPPPFYKAFTTTNLALLAEQTTDSTSQPEPDQKPLPIPLAYLKAPPPPTSQDPDATYPTFQIPQPLHPHPTHPPEDILLYDPATLQNNNPAALLLRLTKSLLLNFLELVSIMSETPAGGQAKIEDVKRLVINLHGVVNGWRPHQGREQVRGMLENMLLEGEEEVRGVDRMIGEVRRYMAEVGGWKERGGEPGTGGGGTEGGEVGRGGEGAGKAVNGHVNGVNGTKTGESTSEERVREVRRLWNVIGEIGEE
jgi:mediator of RNA polymerase II transcription subunit 7